MTNLENKEELIKERLWIFSKAKNSQIDLGSLNQKYKNVFGMEYKISTIAEYLINPEPIKVTKKLVGCQVIYKQSLKNRLLNKLKKIFPKINDHIIPNENIIENTELMNPLLKNHDLENHLNKIIEALRPYSNSLKKIIQLDPNTIINIIGMIDEMGTAQASLKLTGTFNEKIDYLYNNLGKKVNITYNRAYLTNGLFEMGGFNFKKYNPLQFFRLIKFFINNTPSYCIMDQEYNLKYWVEDLKLIYYLQLLEQCLNANPDFNKSFQQCITGNAEAVKLFFNHNFNINYENAQMPQIYQNVFQKLNLSIKERVVITKYLNNAQLGISFHYIPNDKIINDKISTNILVLHNLKAIEPLKNDLPQLYNDISKTAFLSEDGKYYLLDFIKGLDHAE